MATKKQQTYNPVTAAQLLEVLRALGVLDSPDFSGLSKKDLTTLLKDYAKSISAPFEEQDDIISGKYDPSSIMGQALRLIEEGYLPETVESRISGADYQASPEELEDIKDYASYIEKRNESMRERMFDLSEVAGDYGLSNPMQGFDIPQSIVAEKFRVDEQGKSISAPAIERGRAAQAAYNQYLAMKQSGQDTSSFNMEDAIMRRIISSALSEPGETRPGMTVNGVYYPSVQDYENQINQNNLMTLPWDGTTPPETTLPFDPNVDLSQYIQPLTPSDTSRNKEEQELRDEYASSMFGPTISSFYAANQASPGVALPPPPPQQGARTSEPRQRFDYRKNLMENEMTVARNQSFFDERAAQALRNRLEAEYGSPFESDITAAQKALEDRARYEAWLSAEKKRLKQEEKDSKKRRF